MTKECTSINAFFVSESLKITLPTFLYKVTLICSCTLRLRDFYLACFIVFKVMLEMTKLLRGLNYLNGMCHDSQALCFCYMIVCY